MNRHPYRYILLMIAALLASATPLWAEPGEPPEIIVANRPALLVTIDGPPEYVLVKGVKPLLWRVANTRVLLLKNARGRHYLHLYDGYLDAGTLNEPWNVAKKVPPGAVQAEDAARSSKKVRLLEGKLDARTKKKPSLRKAVIPWVFLSMVPAELIVIDGDPDYISIEGTRLFYARNTDSDLFWHQENGAQYLLAAGFWYRADSYLGPWSVVNPGELPPDFRVIPETSVKRKVKASLPPPPPPPPPPGDGLLSNPDNVWFQDWPARRFPWQGPAGTGGFTPEDQPKQWCR